MSVTRDNGEMRQNVPQTVMRPDDPAADESPAAAP